MLLAVLGNCPVISRNSLFILEGKSEEKLVWILDSTVLGYTLQMKQTQSLLSVLFLMNTIPAAHIRAPGLHLRGVWMYSISGKTDYGLVIQWPHRVPEETVSRQTLMDCGDFYFHRMAYSRGTYPVMYGEIMAYALDHPISVTQHPWYRISHFTGKLCLQYFNVPRFYTR